MSRQVLFIGLDGATFDVINPLIQGGWMPNLKGLIANRASGPLQSPPVTGLAYFANKDRSKYFRYRDEE